MRSSRIISDFSLQKDFTHTKSTKSTKCRQATFTQIFLYAWKAQNVNKRLSFRYFYTPKKCKKQTSDFHSDIFICLKSIKSKQVTFTHKKYKTSNKRLSLRYFYTPKKYKKQTSDFHSDIFIHLKSIKSKQATFTHKKHKTSSKLRFRRF